MTVPVIYTKKTILTILGPENAQLMLDYKVENKVHLNPWEPERNNEYFTLSHWEKILAENISRLDNKSAINFSALDQSNKKVVGVCNFTNVVFGVFQACNMGYSISKACEGKGLMTEIITAGIDYIFSKIGLHRIMANYMPHNERSAKLLKRLGFEKEGMAKSYLQIAGKWQDHILTSKINPIANL